MTVISTEPTGSPETVAHELGDALGHLIRLLERTSAQVAVRRADSLDRSAYTVLFHLMHDGPKRSGALAEAMLADPSTVSRHVAQLVASGLVERAADPDDGRATVLAITVRGRETAHNLRARRNATMSRVVAGWSHDDRERFTQLLRTFTADLEEHRPQILADCDQPRGES